MRVWRITGASRFAPPPADWREALARRLGQRPRRIGIWAELALAGALACLDEAGECGQSGQSGSFGERRLPDAALLSVSSFSGPDGALRGAVQAIDRELPMPIAFLQSQPGQVLPVLAQHLGWRGNGRVLTTRDPLTTLHLACLEADPVAGFLLGWVDEAVGGSSLWLRGVASDGNREAAGEWAPESAHRSPHDFALLWRRPHPCFCFDARGRLRVV